MGIFSNLLPTQKNLKDKIKNSKGFQDTRVKTANEIFIEMLKLTSGTSQTRTKKYSIFNQIVGFRGVKEGVGTSTIVANTALALAELGLKVCVLDSSITQPCQDILLNTDYKKKVYESQVKGSSKKIVDWFELPYSGENALNQSKLDRGIAVLSFTERTIVDLLAIYDTEELVELAVSQLTPRFDIILIDICSEPSAVATQCLRMSNVVYQVWSNDRVSLNSVESFITNCALLACPIDKMRNIITSSVIDDIPINWDSIMKKYKFTQLTSIGFSKDIARTGATGTKLWGIASNSEDIEEFNQAIVDIISKILNLDLNEYHTGTITVDDIVEGKIEGTVSKTLKEESELREKRAKEVSEKDTNNAVQSLKLTEEEKLHEKEENDLAMKKLSQGKYETYEEALKDHPESLEYNPQNEEKDISLIKIILNKFKRGGK